MSRVKEVSTRLMRPTQPSLDIDLLSRLYSSWDKEWEVDASVKVYDEGLAQYMLTDSLSHHKFYAALILGKASIRCTVVEEEPKDDLDEEACNVFHLSSTSSKNHDVVDKLKEILGKRGYKFDS